MREDKVNAPYHHGNLRQALLDRAIETLGEKGVEGLSLRGLARDLGVSHAAPLRHFATKSDLLNAIAVEGVGSLFAASEAADADPPGPARLRAMMLAYIDWAKDHSELHHILRNPDVMRHASEDLTTLIAGFSERWREEIKAAQDTGWRSNVDPNVLFLHIVSLTAGTAIVTTEEVYQRRVATPETRSNIEASIDLFLR